MVLDLVNTLTNTIVFINVKATARQNATALNSRVALGWGQYRNAVASGPRLTHTPRRYRVTVLTSSKHGVLTFEMKLNFLTGLRL